MATRGNNGNKPDLSDLKARLGLAPTAKPGAQGPPPGAQGPPGAQRPPQAGQQAPPPGAVAGQPQMQAPPQQAAMAQAAQQMPPQAAHPASMQQPYDAPTANLAPLDAAALQQQMQTPQAAPYQPAAPQPVAAPAPARPGPPPGAKRPKARRDLSSLPVHDVQIDESVAEKPIFSPAVIGMIAGVLCLGLLFGYMYAQSSQARQLYDTQTEAAQELKELLAPKVDASKQVVTIINKLDSTKPEIEQVKKLNEIDFVPGPGTITSKTTFLGGSIVYDTTTFMSKASTLKQLIKRHAELSEADSEEIEKLLAGNAVLNSDQQLAIIYNHKQLIDHIKDKKNDKDYAPGFGSLVAIDMEKNGGKADDQGNIGYKFLNSDNGGDRPILDVIPIKDTDLLKTAGEENALARYKRRTDVLKRYALDLNKHVGTVMDPIEDVANRGGAPLLQMSAPEAPAAAPASSEKPAAEAPPADKKPAEAAPPAK